MEMRIVGISTGFDFFVDVQMRRNNRDWHQERLSESQFYDLMKTRFPNYFAYYEIATENEMEVREQEIKEAVKNYDFYQRKTEHITCWFYNFGETEEMKRKGESYIFR